jgi:aryl-alcohol dehydrogenase-like predicted oxidoreductase
MPPIHYGPCPDAIVNAKAPLTRRGCDNTVCLRAWEQTTGSTHWGEQEPQGGPKMAKLDASKSGTFKIGGEIEINRLGFGAMRITGKGIWGEPEDRPEALRTLKRVPELGIDFIDTADSYGPDVSEELIHEALFPYKEMLIATKAGFQRTGPGVWKMDGRPEWLRSQALSSCKRLGVKRIDLWQLHRIDPKVPRHAQFAAIKSMIDDGIIRFAGLSEVSVADIEEASEVFPVVSVQNRYNLVDRGSEDVLDYCEANGIGFIPWYPLAAGDLAKEGSILDRIAKKHGAAPSQIALACVLKRSPVMLPIPGTSKVKHLEENVAAVNIELTDDEFALLDREGRTASQAA